MPMRVAEEFWEVLRTVEEASWTERAKGAGKLAGWYCARALDRTQTASAEHGFRLLAVDGETIVRRLVAEWLKDAPHLPRDIALQLATDRPEIASPILAHSEALPVEDLLRVIREHPGEHRAAIARRLSLAADVADALCRCGDERAVTALLANRHAELAEETLDWLAEERAEWACVRAVVARRRRPLRYATAC